MIYMPYLCRPIVILGKSSPEGRFKADDIVDVELSDKGKDMKAILVIVSCLLLSLALQMMEKAYNNRRAARKPVHGALEMYRKLED